MNRFWTILNMYWTNSEQYWTLLNILNRVWTFWTWTEQSLNITEHSEQILNITERYWKFWTDSFLIKFFIFSIKSIYFTSLSLPNKVWGTYCFCSVSYYYHYYSYSSSFFPCIMNLSTTDLWNYRTEFHETWWSYRYMFLVDPKFSDLW